VEGSVSHNPLNEGSIVWVTGTRSPLGLVAEVFGAVKSPYYIIRYNSDGDVPSGISVGTAVSFVPDLLIMCLTVTRIYTKRGMMLVLMK
jgi:H/ACA ribonucleoprotein complex non-core subunit NAF1